MSYVPHTDADREAICRRLGIESVEDLLGEVPADLRVDGDLPLPPPLAQSDVEEALGRLGEANDPALAAEVFAGGGVYDHYIPSIVPATIGRPAFYSAYTPYQAEVSQGTLQAIFEFQSLLARLTGMPLANASLYDGATALVEGVWMASAAREGRRAVVVSGAVHPRHRAVLRTHIAASGLHVREIPFGKEGRTDGAALAAGATDRAAVVVVQSPNYFGVLEQTGRFAETAHRAGALFLQIFDPVSLALVRTPGEAGADIAVGEGQSLGSPPGFGGPLLGLFTARREFLRKMPGRLVGMTEDAAGRRAFTLALQTREQHIRREKATSNICTNQGLTALAATVHLSALGPEGLRRAALLSQERALELRAALAEAGATFPFAAPFFREFAVRFPERALRLGLVPALAREGIVPGIPLDGDFPDLAGCFLTATTERRSAAAVRRYAGAVGRFLAGVDGGDDG